RVSWPCSFSLWVFLGCLDSVPAVRWRTPFTPRAAPGWVRRRHSPPQRNSTRPTHKTGRLRLRENLPRCAVKLSRQAKPNRGTRGGGGARMGEGQGVCGSEGPKSSPPLAPGGRGVGGEGLCVRKKSNATQSNSAPHPNPSPPRGEGLPDGFRIA